MTWQQIFRFLVDASEPVSGELIAQHTHLTRAAIWKQINFLNKQGFEIERFRKSGYKLKFPVDTPVAINHKTLKTKHLATEVITKITTDSTNNDAISIAESAIEGTLIIAENQTNGRGRRGRNWISPFGKGLYFSLILKPSISVVKLPKLTILAGVCVAKSLRRLGIDVLLKWPNDIMLNNKKIGGILSELFVEGEEARYVILGIGLNVHTENADFPPELSDIAGSIYSETGKSCSRIDLLKSIIEELDAAYNSFLKNDGALGVIADEWNEMAWQIGEYVWITTGKGKEHCKIIKLREDGVLLVSKGRELKEVFVGEILL